MIAAMVRRLSAWIRSRRQPARSPLQQAGDELRATAASLPAGLASVEGTGPLMRAFDPLTDPVLQQLRDRHAAHEARSRRYELDSRTGHGRRDLDAEFEHQKERLERAIPRRMTDRPAGRH